MAGVSPEQATTALVLPQLGLGEDTKELASHLTDPLPHRRGLAAWTLGLLGEDRYALPVAGLLRDPDGAVRAHAALSLASLGASHLTGEILPLLGDESSEARRCAAEALERLAAREHSARLVSLLYDRTAGVRIQALRALAGLEARESIREIHRLLRDRHPDVRIEALKAMAALGATLPPEEAAPFLTSPRAAHRRDSVLALARLLPGDALRRLEPLTRDSSRQVRIAAEVALFRDCPTDQGKAQRLLSELLWQEDRNILSDLLNLLLQTHDPASHSALSKVASPDYAIRTPSDLKATFLRKWRLSIRIDPETDPPFFYPPRIPITGRRLLERLFPDRLAVPEPRSIVILDYRRACRFWQRHLRQAKCLSQ